VLNSSDLVSTVDAGGRDEAVREEVGVHDKVILRTVRVSVNLADLRQRAPPACRLTIEYADRYTPLLLETKEQERNRGQIYLP